MSLKLTRRDFVAKAALATGAIGLANDGFSLESLSPMQNDPTINIFSKNLHWLDYAGMSSFARETGFDGIDLTVRPEGHVLPERVKDDLPRAIESIRKAGLRSDMIVTAITSADDPYAEDIIKTASQLGVKYSRMGWISYDEKKSIEENLALISTRLKRLAELNKHYGITGDYQNHSGTSFGSPVWDIDLVFKGLDPKWVGVQYDVMHAHVEGGNSWTLGLKLIRPYVHTIDIKDFVWAKTASGWKSEVVPIGSGLINYPRYLTMLHTAGIRGPFSMHFEYPLGGAENGAKTITMSPENVKEMMKKDLATFRQLLKEAGF